MGVREFSLPVGCQQNRIRDVMCCTGCFKCLFHVRYGACDLHSSLVIIRRRILSLSNCSVLGLSSVLTIEPSRWSPVTDFYQQETFSEIHVFLRLQQSHYTYLEGLDSSGKPRYNMFAQDPRRRWSRKRGGFSGSSLDWTPRLQQDR